MRKREAGDYSPASSLYCSIWLSIARLMKPLTLSPWDSALLSNICCAFFCSALRFRYLAHGGPIFATIPDGLSGLRPHMYRNTLGAWLVSL